MNSSPFPPHASAFDPFGNRTARETRNRLSTGFIRSIEAGDLAGLGEMAKQLCPPEADRSCSAYVDERMIRYRRAFDRIRAEAAADPVRRAVVLWNEGLFFEVHEMLESVWNDKERRRKEALRGLIQAAGVFVHRERGAGQAATKLALRAADHLQQHGEALPEIENLEELIAALKNPGKAPPVLRLRG